MFADTLKNTMLKPLFFLLLILSAMASNAQTPWYRVDDPDMMGCIFIDTLGNESPVGSHDKLRIGEIFSEGLISVNFKEDVLDNDAWGCLNEKGDTVIKGKYLESFCFSDRIAKVSVSLMPWDTNSWDYDKPYYCQYINRQGSLISDKIFEAEYSTEMSNNCAIAKYGKQWYLLSKTGKLKELSVDYETVSPFSNGLAKCKRMNHYTEYIDTTGWPVLDIPNENFSGDFVNGFAPYSTVKDKYGFINKKGNPVTACIYEALSGFSEGVAAVKLYNKWGFIDASGKIVINFKYESASQFSEGLARVKVNGKYGFIDKNGKSVIANKFTNVSNFRYGLAAASDAKNLWGFINKKGQWVIKPQFISAQNFDKFGFAIVLYADKYSDVNDETERYEKALINRTGKMIWQSGEKLVVK